MAKNPHGRSRAGFMCDLTRTKRRRADGTRQTDGWPPHEESNLDFRFRRPVFYPLNYGEAKLEF
jgi:hypothetical protein